MIRSKILAMREFGKSWMFDKNQELVCEIAGERVIAFSNEKTMPVRHVVLFGLFDGKRRVGFSALFGPVAAKYAKQAKKLGVYKKTPTYRAA